uniref:Fibronectin type-III domain-containing protein n=1 Tax=Panagrolaimus sp. JU765 TaxID=591449 RepID=A0AC34R6E1_9BILA
MTSTIFYVLFLSFLCLTVFGEPSRRAKCALECYLKCVASGTPKAVYCNCPLKDANSECNFITDKLIKAETTSDVPVVEAVYKDVRTINVKLVNGVPSAFIYVFEYSAVSIEKEQWIFAGASSSPQITFTIPDSCRDYRFRVLVVLRSTDPAHQLVAFHPRAIPVNLPSFSVGQEMIHLDPPRQSNDDQSLNIVISWPNPRGYFDADIYGYESPVAYPIRCMIPEDSLSQPRIEIVQDGARMHLSLPIDVLEEKCRIFLEVRMIPRCVRLEPFDIQASVEIDCQKFPMLNFCKKEMTPQCAEIVDIWGEDGKASIVWQPPVSHRIPLYYQISHGLTQSHGTFPFVTKKIIQNRETRVPGNQTKFDLLVQTGIEYGVQICAIFSNRQTKNYFNIVPVISFSCLPCANSSSKFSREYNCIECSKVEDAENMVPVECLSQACATNNLTTHFISMNTAELDIKNSTERSMILNGNSVNPQQKHSKIISTNEALPVNPTDLEENPFHVNETLDLLLSKGDDMDLLQKHEPTIETTTEIDESSTLSSTDSTTEAVTDATTTEESDERTGHVELMEVTTPIIPENKTVISTTTEAERTTVSSTDSSTPTTILPLAIEDLKKPPTKVKADGVRLHPPKLHKPCKQKNGIVCEFGCLDHLRCDCPKSEKSCIRGINCPFVKDLRAVYENQTRTLKLFSRQISQVLKNATFYDKIYLEFGEIGPADPIDGRKSSNNEFVFKSPDKERAVISLEHTNLTSLFDTIPYLMTVEKPLKVGDLNYGLSICALNSSLVPVIMDNVFMEQNLFNENSISSFTQTLLSPIEVDEEAQIENDVKKSLILVVGPVLLIFAAMIFVGALLCASVIRDRRQSPSEKFRRRGILRDQSSTQFTGFRHKFGDIGSNNISATKANLNKNYDNQQQQRFYIRNVHF